MVRPYVVAGGLEGAGGGGAVGVEYVNRRPLRDPPCQSNRQPPLGPRT